jgi:hypothetical protein
MFIEDEARTKNFFARKRATLRRCLSSLWVARLCDRLVVAIMGAPLVVMVRAYAQSYQPCVGPLSFAQTILSDREQQLTLIRTVYAALFVVCLVVATSACAFLKIDFAPGGRAKIAWPRRRQWACAIFLQNSSTTNFVKKSSPRVRQLKGGRKAGLIWPGGSYLRL